MPLHTMPRVTTPIMNTYPPDKLIEPSMVPGTRHSALRAASCQWLATVMARSHGGLVSTPVSPLEPPAPPSRCAHHECIGSRTKSSPEFETSAVTSRARGEPG